MTTTYSVDQSRLAAYRRKSALSSFMLYGSLGALTVLIVNRGNFSPSGLISMASGLGATLLCISLFVWASLRTLKRQAATMRIVLDDETISREVADVPNVSLRLAEITHIEEYPGTGLMVRTADRRKHLYLPELLREYDLLREHLATRWPLQRKQNSTQLMLRCLAGAALPTALFLLILLVTIRPLVMALGAVTVAGSLGLAVYAQRVSAYPRWFKMMTWVLVPLILVLVLQRLNRLP